MDTNVNMRDVKKKAGGFISEFKEFISRGNVMDMAVGIIVGSAFTSIVNSLVNDILMPLISFIVGDLDFTDWKLVLKQASGEAEAITLSYGAFIQQIINFLLIALVIFVMIKAMNSFRRKKEEAPAEAPKPSEEVVLLTQIRDLLQK
ncbi:MAG: large-conductance mechanosensitive channel protein MscL [Eubacteriales bacterium]|nr:large-conductance mechanosensitive channel protein MscL [Eubacteriales bacterium]